jgi:CO/xanthine dehydrogenase Mo-binding subunit
MKLTRRKLLVGTGVVGGGLIIGVSLSGKGPLPQTVANSFQPNAWLQLSADGEIVFQLDKAEMGQGVYTALTTIIGEELDVDPTRIRVEMAGVHPAYKNPAMGMQVTGGSTSVATAFEPLRKAGAAARNLLLTSAAQRWGLEKSSLRIDDGVVIHDASNRRASYAELVEGAKRLPVPENVSLKDPKDFRWIGKNLSRFDNRDKSTGAPIFGADVVLPNMRVAVVVRCPHFGGKALNVDDSAAKSHRGVDAVFPIHNGIAVVAQDYWQARKAAEKLVIEWNKGPLAGLSSADILANQEAVLANHEDPINALSEGDTETVLQQADVVIEARYSAPFLHHSPMEPQNATALVTGEKMEVWAPSQAPDFVQMLASEFSGFARDKITVHSTHLGGGFGRRAMTDFVGEVAAIAAQMPGVPIKLMWSREDDMRHDFYRPSTLHRVRAALDSEGKIAAYDHRLVSASIIQGMAATVVDGYLPNWLPKAMAQAIGRTAGSFAGGRDTSMAEGALIPYQADNKKVEIVPYDPGVPLGFWRSVGHSHNAFVAESFIDELAHAAGQDPVQYRLNALSGHPRHIAVLKAVADAASWGKSIPGRIQGVAVHESFASYVAEIVELVPEGSGNSNSFRIERVVCAVDCGLIINPKNVIAQIESAVNYGLTAALKAPITIDDGKVVQSNFHDLPVIRINEAPRVDVVLIESSENPSGVGEVGLPPLAPALGNALFAATGVRQRDLPLRLSV